MMDKETLAKREKEISDFVISGLNEMCGKLFTVQQKGAPRAISEFKIVYDLTRPIVLHPTAERSGQYLDTDDIVIRGALLGAAEAWLRYHRGDNETVLIWRTTPEVTIMQDKDVIEQPRIWYKLYLRAHTMTPEDFAKGPVPGWEDGPDPVPVPTDGHQPSY